MKSKLKKELCELMIFTARYSDPSYIIFKNKYKNIRKKDGKYYFLYDNQEYEFSMLSDESIYSKDKKILKSFRRLETSFFRTLRLSLSLNLVDSSVIIGSSDLGEFDTIIICKKNGLEYIINYARNLIMKKDDYYKLFNFQEKQFISNYDIYRLSVILEQTHDYKNIATYIDDLHSLFEQYKDNEEFTKYCVFSDDKYDSIGINAKNYLLFGVGCDRIFYQGIDYNSIEFLEKLDRKTQDIINKFTLKPKKSLKVIKSRKFNSYYVLSLRYGIIKFSLLSDLIESQKDMLLSEERYEKCHNNAIALALLLNDDANDIFIIGGKTKENEIDYFYHSWIEIRSKNQVLDANRNLVIDKDIYYKLYGATKINETSLSDMIAIIDVTVRKFEIYFSPMDFNYFGNLIYSDLLRNKKILERNKEE